MTLMMKIPIVLWGDQQPSHQVTCMTVCNNGIIVTGSVEGQLIFWTIDLQSPNIYVRPQNMIIAHSSSVKSLVSIHNKKLDIHSGVISLDDNQELCLWNSETGCCLINTYLRGRFCSLSIIPCRNPKALRECLLACYGYKNIIYLLDPFNFQKLYILRHNGPIGGIQTVRSLSSGFVADQDEDLVLSITQDGTVKVYGLPAIICSIKSEKPTKIDGNIIELDQHIPRRKIRSLLVEPVNCLHILLWTFDEIYIVNFSNFNIINVISTNELAIRDIVFFDEFSFIVYFENHPSIFYDIDRRYTVSRQIMLYMPDNPVSPLVSASIYSIRHDLKSKFIFGATQSGHILSWDMSLPNLSNQCQKLPFISYTSLDSLWIKYRPIGAAMNLPQVDSHECRVSCSIQLSDYGFMILGLKNGSIFVANTIELLWYQLLGYEKMKRLSNIVLKGHIGPVTCLCHPFDECNKYDPCYLLSGGADFSVRLWNIVTGTQLKIYYPHGGQIQEILVMSGECITSSNLTVISIANDYSVALINLAYDRATFRSRCHTSPVFSVKWKIPEDILLVYCIDGTLFIWEVTTGNLERCVTGKPAVEIFDDHDADLKDLRGGDDSSFLGVINVDSPTQEKHHYSIFHHFKAKHGFLLPHKHAAQMIPTKKKGIKRVLRKISFKHRHHWNISETKEQPKENSRDSSPSMFMYPIGPLGGASNIASHPAHHSSACNLAISHSGSFHSYNTNSDILQTLPTAFVASFDAYSLQTGHHDSNFHVFVIDFDSVIALLMCEEDKIHSDLFCNKNVTQYDSGSSLFSDPGVPNEPSCPSMMPQLSLEKLPITVLKMGLTTTSDIQAYKKYSKYLQEYRSYMILITAKLLFACLHPWNLDERLDDLCKNKLKITQPYQPVSFGFMSRHKLLLNFPGWHPNLNQLQNCDPTATPSTVESIIGAQRFITHWQISSIVTAQHLVSLIAIANSFMNIYKHDKYIDAPLPDINYSSPKVSPEMLHSHVTDSPLHRKFVTVSVPDLAHEGSLQKCEEQGMHWSALFHGYCSMVSLLMQKKLYHHTPCIHELICYWMDSFDEIRHASYCILLIELKNMTASSRRSLVRSWCLYLPTSEQVENMDVDEFLILPTDDYMESGGFYGFWPSDRRYQRTIAVFLVSFIISEFSKEFDPLIVGENSSECIISVSTIIILSNIMSKLLKSRLHVKEYTQYPMRKAFIFFLGRAFSVWQPHINLSQILMSILETNAYVDFYIQYLNSINRHKSHQCLQLSELLSKYRSSLRDIMLTHSDVVVTVINKEFPRYSSVNSHITMGQSSLVAAVVCSVRQQQNPLTSQPSRVQLVRSEIECLIEMMAKRCPDQFIKLIMEVIDLLLSCNVNKIVKKEADFMLFFPFLKKFPMIDYCVHTRRLVVGKTNGQFGIYELRNLRCTLVNSFTKPITCLKFCPDGKQLVTYCHDEQKICLWNTHVYILGLISNTPKPGIHYQLKQKVNQPDLRKIHVVWNNTNSFRLVFNDTISLSFTA